VPYTTAATRNLSSLTCAVLDCLQAQSEHNISALQQHMRILNGLVQQAEKAAHEAQHSLVGWVPPDEVEELHTKVCIHSPPDCSLVRTHSLLGCTPRCANIRHLGAPQNFELKSALAGHVCMLPCSNEHADLQQPCASAARNVVIVLSGVGAGSPISKFDDCKKVQAVSSCSLRVAWGPCLWGQANRRSPSASAPSS